MSHSRTGSTEDTFKFKTGHYIGIALVMIEDLHGRRIKGFTAGAQNERTDGDLLLDNCLAVIDGFLADNPKLTSADLAARRLEEPGLVVHRRSIERALARRKKRGR